MFKLFDKAFWKFFSGFVLILVVSFSILTVVGVFRSAQEQYAAIWEAVSGALSR